MKQINRRKKKEKEWINTIINQASIGAQESLIDDKILEAVKLLPCQQKKRYIYLGIQGLKPMEIAWELNISLKTGKKHSMLAKRFLKRKLSENIIVSLNT